MPSRTLSRIGLAFIPPALAGLLALWLLPSGSAVVAFVPDTTTNSSNANATFPANANGRANVNSSVPTPAPSLAFTPAPTPFNTNRAVNANMSRDDYEREKARYEDEARRSGRTVGSGVNDAWLWTKVRAQLLAADDLRESTINVDVENDVVTLSGSVADGAQKIRAADIARKVDGVKAVVNKLTVQGDRLTRPEPRPRGGSMLSPDRPDASVRFVPAGLVHAQTRGAARERDRLETEVPRALNMGEGAKVFRLSLIRFTAGAATPPPQIEGREVVQFSPVPVGTPDVPLKDAFGPEYEAAGVATLKSPSFDPPSQQESKPLEPANVTWQWHIAPKIEGAQDVNVSLAVRWKHRRTGRVIEHEVLNHSFQVSVRGKWLSEDRIKLATGLCTLITLFLQIPSALNWARKKKEPPPGG